MNTKAINDLLKHCKDPVNPRWELTGICVEEDKLIVTDTRQLLILKFKENFTKESNIMLFTANNKRCDRPKNLSDLLDANDCLLDMLGYRACNIENTGEFPDYKRIILPKELCKTASFSLCYDKDAADYLNYRCMLLNDAIFASKYLYKFCQLLGKLKKDFSIEIWQKEAECPLLIKGNVIGVEDNLMGFMYLVMPLTLDADKKFKREQAA